MTNYEGFRDVNDTSLIRFTDSYPSKVPNDKPVIPYFPFHSGIVKL
jgi:hypothetical protein